jgi:hypothetical protein
MCLWLKKQFRWQKFVVEMWSVVPLRYARERERERERERKSDAGEGSWICRSIVELGVTVRQRLEHRKYFELFREPQKVHSLSSRWTSSQSMRGEDRHEVWGSFSLIRRCMWLRYRLQQNSLPFTCSFHIKGKRRSTTGKTWTKGPFSVVVFLCLLSLSFVVTWVVLSVWTQQQE